MILTSITVIIVVIEGAARRTPVVVLLAVPRPELIDLLSTAAFEHLCVVVVDLESDWDVCLMRALLVT